MARSRRRPRESFVKGLIHNGILQCKTDRTGYEVPIPSMATWLLDEYARGLDTEEKLEADEPSP